MTGAQMIYEQIKAWAEFTRPKFKEWLVEYGRPVVGPEGIQAILTLMTEAMELETEMISLMTDEPWTEYFVNQSTDILRDIRQTLGRVVGTTMVENIERDWLQPEDFGVTYGLNEDKSGFWMELPYELISTSDLFMLRSKRLPVQFLPTVRHGWQSLMRSVAKRLKQELETPMPGAEVTVTITIDHPQPLDPDHFWIRPIVDGLVQNRILMNDDANSIVFIQAYKLNRKEKKVRIEFVRASKRSEDDGKNTSHQNATLPP